jgi:hypothetical protein
MPPPPALATAAEIVDQAGIETALGAAAANDAKLTQDHRLVKCCLTFGEQPCDDVGRAEPHGQP